MKYLLDTNVLAAFTVRYGNESLQLRITSNLEVSAISVITVAELIYGTSLMPVGKRRKEVESRNADLLTRIKVLDFDEAAARCFGEERARIKQSGRQPPDLDLMIAATAVTRDLIAVTDNLKDFSLVKGLRWENWLAESKL